MDPCPSIVRLLYALKYTVVLLDWLYGIVGCMLYHSVMASLEGGKPK